MLSFRAIKGEAPASLRNIGGGSMLFVQIKINRDL